MRCKTSCGNTRPHTTSLASICAYCATNHCQCPAYGNMEHDQRCEGEGFKKGNRMKLALHALVQRIEELRIIEEDLVGERRRNIFARAHGGDELALFGWILMAVIGTDQQMILAGVFRNIFDILVRFAGDENPILTEHVFV